MTASIGGSASTRCSRLRLRPLRTQKSKALLHACCIGLIVLAGQPKAFAETRKECQAALRPETTIALSSGLGAAVLGPVIGVASCSTLLATAVVDAGISAGVCVALFTLLGTVTGTAIAEAANANAAQGCAKLPE